ncbi:MAG: SdrD B-like domain-containing protein [Tepidisphaeraceae bacterium]
MPRTTNRLNYSALHSAVEALETRQLLAVAGDLDPSFGGAGYVVTNLPAGTPVSSVMAYQPDGKLLIAGIRVVNAGVSTERFTLTRLTAAGTLDATFGVNGVAEFGSPVIGSVNTIKPTGIALTSDGSILASYFWGSSSSTSTSSTATNVSTLVRYQPNGASSAEVTTRRQTITSAGLGPIVLGDTFSQFALAPNGKIYLAGTLANPALPSGQSSSQQAGIARLNADGSLDTTFDGDGLAFPTIEGQKPLGISRLAAASDGSVVYSGEFASLPSNPGVRGIFVSRLNASGAIGPVEFKQLDPSLNSSIGSLGVLASGVSVFQYQYATSITPTTKLLIGTMASGVNVPYFASPTGWNGAATALSIFNNSAAGAMSLAGDVLISYGLAPGTRPVFDRSYDFGGVDQVFTMRDLLNGKLAVAGQSTDSGGVSRVVVGRVLTSAPVASKTWGGVVFNDLNNNQTLDSTEPKLAGVRVYDDANSNYKFDAGETSVLTDASGHYAFTVPQTASMRISVVAPTGAIATGSMGQYGYNLSTTLSADTCNFPVRFTTVGTAIIAGVVFNDASGNGWRDGAEAGVSGRTVFIDANNNGSLDTGEQTAVTDSGGYYALRNLPTGTLSVRQVVPAGFVATTASVQNVTLTTAGQYKYISDFGTKPASTTPLPATPKDLTVGVNASGGVVLKWTDAATNETAYYVRRKVSGSSAAFVTIASLGANATTFTDTSAIRGTKYDYTVMCANAGNTQFSANNPVLTILVPTAAPAAPTNAKATIVTTPSKRVRLTWTDVATNETSYRVERRYRGASTWTNIATLAGNSTMFDDTTILNGVVYEYHIVALNSAGTAASAVLTAAT